MPKTRKRAAGAGRKRHHTKGGSIGDVLKSAHDFIKKNKIISTVGNALSGVPYVGPVAGAVGSIAGHLGYGRHHGMGPFDMIQKLPNGHLKGTGRRTKLNI